MIKSLSEMIDEIEKQKTAAGPKAGSGCMPERALKQFTVFSFRHP